jgi:hypothetical protein
MTDKLYRVWTVVNKYNECRNVTFEWFYYGERTPPRGYTELIENYKPEPHRQYVEAHVDELFTESAAQQLFAYLERGHGGAGTTTIEEVKLPVPNNLICLSAIPVGGGDDFYMLYKEKNYDLPFAVQGYFDLVGCDMLDGSGVHHHRLLLIQPNGEVR